MIAVPQRSAAALASSESRSHGLFLVYSAWVVAFIATLGSLFFGEVMGLPICTLCWYQRIFIYPLVILFPIGILLRDRYVTHYTLPLVLVGLGFAVYHNLLYYGVISESLTPCVQSVPCTSRQIEWLGFVTIPLMSLGAFVVILGCLLAYKWETRNTLI